MKISRKALKMIFLLPIILGSTLFYSFTASAVPAMPQDSQFNDVATDSAGNTYAVGEIGGNLPFDFGNGVTVTGGVTGANAVIVKYDSNGLAQWARSTTSPTGPSRYRGVSVDSSGNIYAVGYIDSGLYAFGDGVSVSGANIVIVKYDSDGTAQWAKSGNGIPFFSSGFYDVTTDSSGNIYAVGDIGNTEVDFGNGVTVVGSGPSYNSLLVKYDSTGTTLWARTTVSAHESSCFNGVTVGDSGDIYAVGYINGYSSSIGLYDFGNGATVTCGSGINSLVVKYDSSGMAQWAKSNPGAPSNSTFSRISSDSSGNIYMVGDIWGLGQYDFGNGVIVSGDYDGPNPIVLKYDSSGMAQWVKSVNNAKSYSSFSDISIDSSGNVYVVGNVYGDAEGMYPGGGEFDFGNGVTFTAANAYANSIIVKYNSAGNAQWATSSLTPVASKFFGVSIDQSGNIFAVGCAGNNAKDAQVYGNSIALEGGIVSYVQSSLIVKYDPAGIVQWARLNRVTQAETAFPETELPYAGKEESALAAKGKTQWALFGCLAGFVAISLGLSAQRKRAKT